MLNDLSPLPKVCIVLSQSHRRSTRRVKHTREQDKKQNAREKNIALGNPNEEMRIFLAQVGVFIHILVAKSSRHPKMTVEKYRMMQDGPFTRTCCSRKGRSFRTVSCDATLLCPPQLSGDLTRSLKAQN